MDFLSSENLCGQNLLRLTSRGSAIIAELLRLANNIPECFYGAEKAKDPEQKKYCDILFDYSYINEPEDCEKKLNASTVLLDLDEEFRENYTEILQRFYRLFESVWKFSMEINKYVDDINNGYYLQHSLDNILQDTNGRQLILEMIYLYGEMLLLLEEYIPGPVRERIMMANYRYYGDRHYTNIEEVCKLVRSTGYVKGNKKPSKYPEAFFARSPLDADMLRLAIGRLQTDDIYLMDTSFPNPDHRSTRLASQASMLYVTLYFVPTLLHKDNAFMREIVDKFFNDNWVISTYMGHVIDVSAEWQSYPAAKKALDTVFAPAFVTSLNEKNATQLRRSTEEMVKYLQEGVLQQDYLFANMNALLSCIRSANVSLRWRLLHRRTQDEKIRRGICDFYSATDIMSFLLNLSQLEYKLKDLFRIALDEKERAWTDGRSAAAERMQELGDYFTGEKALSKVKRDENLMRWFSNLAAQVNALDLEEDHATATGRKIQGIISALDDVEHFEAIDTSVQIKSYLGEIRDIFKVMIRTVNIKREISHIIDNISDLSYAWHVLDDYLSILHDRIKQDPASVVLLRATFLKLASILDVPLVRITAIDSPDAESVAEYYSSELVEFVRRVLEIIPVSIFQLLTGIVDIQIHRMTPIPIRPEAKDLKDYAQLDLRFELARLTHQVSIFTEGILVMEKTLLGIIQVDPRQILEEGLRRELVRQITHALHSNLLFKELSRQEINKSLATIASTLDGFKRSIEYIQDYIDTAGLKIFQQEISRVFSYYTEQEANRYLKKKTFDTSSRYQSKTVPIPKYESVIVSEEYGGNNFLGRAMSAVLFLTDSTCTIYAPECSAWFIHPAPDQKQVSTVESCGIRTFLLLERSLGVAGMIGIDRLLAFRSVYEINVFLKFYKTEVNPFRTLFEQVREGLFPDHVTVPNATKLYGTAMKRIQQLMLPLLKTIRKLGQSQLIRRHIAHCLQFGCQLEAHVLYESLDTFNCALVNDVKRHYTAPETFPYPVKSSPLLFETVAMIESCGMDDPFHKVYATSEPLEGLPVLLFIFLLTYLPKLEYDSNFGALVRTKSTFPLDGIPLVVGISCLLKQFHPSATKQLISYLGQFVRTNIQQSLQEIDAKTVADTKLSVEIPKEVLNTLIFMDHLCHYSSVPRSVVHNCVPPYIFDSIKIAKPVGK